MATAHRRVRVRRRGLQGLGVAGGHGVEGEDPAQKPEALEQEGEPHRAARNHQPQDQRRAAGGSPGLSKAPSLGTCPPPSP